MPLRPLTLFLVLYVPAFVGLAAWQAQERGGLTPAGTAAALLLGVPVATVLLTGVQQSVRGRRLAPRRPRDPLPARSSAIRRPETRRRPSPPSSGPGSRRRHHV